MPTQPGRVVAIILGACVGTYLGFDVLKDYKLIERLDDPSERDANGHINRAFKVTFKPTSPLKHKDDVDTGGTKNK